MRAPSLGSLIQTTPSIASRSKTQLPSTSPVPMSCPFARIDISEIESSGRQFPAAMIVHPMMGLGMFSTSLVQMSSSAGT